MRELASTNGTIKAVLFGRFVPGFIGCLSFESMPISPSERVVRHGFVFVLHLWDGDGLRGYVL